MLLALTRPVSPSLAACQLTFLDRQPIDIPLAIQQHYAYEQTLGDLGVEIVRLPARPEWPDAVFVEDTAIVLDEMAIITSLGTPSRQPETLDVATTLAHYRRIVEIRPPASIEGGDVLRIGRTLFVGRSGRTNDAGIEQLRKAVETCEYVVRAVAVNGCLHLKTACSYVGRNTILINPEWVAQEAFARFDLIPVPPSDPWGANVLLLGDVVVAASASRETAKMLEDRGFLVRRVDLSELQKAEGGATCLSLILTK